MGQSGLEIVDAGRPPAQVYCDTPLNTQCCHVRQTAAGVEAVLVEPRTGGYQNSLADHKSVQRRFVRLLALIVEELRVQVLRAFLVDEHHCLFLFIRCPALPSVGPLSTSVAQKRPYVATSGTLTASRLSS